MSATRRQFLQSTIVASGAACWVLPDLQAAEDARSLIVDTHQHLWDLSRQTLPWLAGAPDVLKHDYRSQEYAAATTGLLMRTVYMEVDVAPEQHDAEAEFVIGLCRDPQHPMVGAVIGGRPDAPQFADYIQKHMATGQVRGVRQVLHGDATPAGHCLRPEFVKGVQLLGKLGVNFDLCMRPGELADARQLAEECPETRFVLDHCGNADINAFVTGAAPASHDPAAWKREIAALAQRPNVFCKISGIIAKAQAGWTVADLAPVVNHCLDSFGPDRVVFGGDWPVCLLGAPLSKWVAALTTIMEKRPLADQRKLWSENAVAVYRLPRDLKRPGLAR